MNEQPGRKRKYLDGWIRRCLRCLCWRQLGIFNWHLPTIWISALKEDTGNWEPGFKASVNTIVHSNKYVWNSDTSETSQSSWFGFPDNPHRTDSDRTDTFTISQPALYLSISLLKPTAGWTSEIHWTADVCTSTYVPTLLISTCTAASCWTSAINKHVHLKSIFFHDSWLEPSK